MDAALSTIVNDCERLLRGDDAGAKCDALRVLSTWLLLDMDTRAAVTQAAFAAGLVAAVESVRETAATHAKDQELAFVTLGLLADANRTATTAAQQRGMMTAIMRMLQTPARCHQSLALALTRLLTHDNAAVQAAAIDAGIVPVLLLFLTAPPGSVRVLALSVLDVLATNQQWIEARDLYPLVRLLQDGYDDERAIAARVVARVQENNRERVAALMYPSSREDGPRYVYVDAVDSPLRLARSVLLHFVDGSLEKLTTSETIASVIGQLLDRPGNSDDPASDTLTLECIKEWIAQNDLVANASAVDARLVRLCVQRLGSSVEREEKYASLILYRLLLGGRYDWCGLTSAVVDQLDSDALVELLVNGKYGLVHLLVPLVRHAETELAAAGVVPLLVRIVGHGRWSESQAAARALQSLLWRNHGCQTEALHAGAMALVVRRLREADGRDTRVFVDLMRVLVERNAAAKDAFVDAGGAPVLVRVLAHGRRNEQIGAIGTAYHVTKDHALAQAALTEAGAVPAVVDLLYFVPAVAMALDDSVRCHAANKATIVHGVGLVRLVQTLHNAEKEDTYSAASTIAILAADDSDAQSMIAEADAIEPLVKLLAHQSGYAAQTAAKALGALVQNHARNETIVVEANAKSGLVAMIFTRPRRSQRAAATKTLLFLVEGRSPITRAAAIEAGVADALRVVLKEPGSDPSATQCKQDASMALTHLDAESLGAESGE